MWIFFAIIASLPTQAGPSHLSQGEPNGPSRAPLIAELARLKETLPKCGASAKAKTELALDKNSAARSGADFNAAMSEIWRKKLALGWPNAFAISALLLREAGVCAASERWADATVFAEVAHQLSPSSLSAHVALLSYRLQGSSHDLASHDLASHDLASHDLGVAARELWVTAKIAGSDFFSASTLLSNLTAGAFLLVLLLPSVLLLILFLRHLRYVAHDLGLLMPRGVHPALGYLVIALLLAAPILLQLGAVAEVFILFAIPFFHEETSERLWATLCLLLLAATPLMLPRVAELWLLPSGRAADLYVVTRAMATDGLDAEASVQRLEQDLARVDSPTSRVALGLFELRSGRSTAARQHFFKATQIDDKRDDAWVNLGVSDFALGHFDEAEAAFEKAVERNPDNIVALFNLARMYYRGAGHDRGNQAYSRAQALAPDLTSALLAASRLIGPGYVAQETLPPDELWRAQPYPSERIAHERTAHDLGPFFLGPVPKMTLALAALGWVLFLASMSLLVDRVVPCLPCPRCGRPVCIHTDTELPDRSLCGQCYHAFVKADVDSATRIRKELSCLRYERRRDGLARVLSVLFPGTGHLYLGQVTRGAIAMTLGSVFLIVLLLLTNVLPTPVRMGEPLLQMAALYLCLGGFLSVLLVSVLGLRSAS